MPPWGSHAHPHRYSTLEKIPAGIASIVCKAVTGWQNPPIAQRSHWIPSFIRLTPTRPIHQPGNDTHARVRARAQQHNLHYRHGCGCFNAHFLSIANL